MPIKFKFPLVKYHAIKTKNKLVIIIVKQEHFNLRNKIELATM